MNQTRKITLSAMFLALALVLPFITGQIPEFGQALTPMHFPVLLGSFFAGPLYGFIIGLIAPLLRQLLFGTPPFPMSLMMAFELGTYGVLGGFLFNQLKPRIKNDAISIYISLIIAMIVGRVIFSIAALIFTGATNFFVVFFGLFTGSIPGIILQIILIPILYLRLKRATT